MSIMHTENRHGWTFFYTASDVLDGAKRKLKHHTERLGHYNGEFIEADKDLKENGITWDDPVVVSHTAPSSSYNPAPQMRVDQERQRRVNAAKTKIQEHQERVTEYEHWVKLLQRLAGTDSKHQLYLTVADAIYFDLA